MLTKNTLNQFREFRELKARKHRMPPEQYIKALQLKLESIKAERTSPNLSIKEANTIMRLLGNKKSI